MAYTESSTFPPEQSDPSFAFLVSGGADINLSQIFNGLPQFYAGSSFVIEEIFEGKCEILQPELIDTDFRWFPPKRYFGTWTVSDTLPGFGVSPEDRGFVDSEIFKIKRYSTFVIQANANVSIAEHEEGAIDNCNFVLNEVGIDFPPFSGKINTLATNDAIFKMRTTIRNVPLQDRVFYPKLRFVGLYINVGSVLTEAKYTARIINGVSVDLPSFPATPCAVAPEFDCDAEFTNFLATQNASLPNPRLFRTYEEAVAQGTLEGLIVDVNYSVPESGFPCSGKVGVVNYYRFINLFS